MEFRTTIQPLPTTCGVGHRADDAVSPALSSFRISKRRLKQVESIELIREQRERRQQQLALHARPFVFCGLPLRRPPTDQLLYSRSNGKFFLQVLGHPQFRLPFGEDRLIPIWMATLAVRQRSRIVRFHRASEMLDFFRLFKDGKRCHRIMEGFQRIFASTIFFGCSDRPEGKLVLDWARFHYFDRLHLWFHMDETDPPPTSPDENVVVLSEPFYEEIDAHRIPVEREVVAALANAPGVLDLHLWLVWKTWSLNGHSVHIPLFTSGGLADQLGSREYSADRFFRRKLSRWLAEVKSIWPQCPAQVSPDGQCLILHSSRKAPAIVSLPFPARHEMPGLRNILQE